MNNTRKPLAIRELLSLGVVVANEMDMDEPALVIPHDTFSQGLDPDRCGGGAKLSLEGGGRTAMDKESKP